jgi:nitroimidazol reductase NimA-like FMN-containing flavoprotein (pyridoxamine 5'-phosphate oxidase superfamily)
MSENQIDTVNSFNAEEHVHPMTQPEMDQFLTVSPVGRLGMSTPEGPYVLPVGYCYSEGKIFIHMCGIRNGRMMRVLKEHPVVCFEVDESLSDCSLAKSVIITGRAELFSEPKQMIPYLQMHIDKYRVSRPYGEYASRNNRKAKALETYGRPELEILTICRITPYQMTGRSIVRTNSNF